MSGGYWNYQDLSLRSEIFGYGDNPCNALEDREVSELVWEVFELLHAYDWYRSGDTCKATYLEALRKFKKKWFETVRRDRIKRIIDETFAEAKQELYQTFDIQEDSTSDAK